jgi:dolichol-phosphate mannosyltransferase
MGIAQARRIVGDRWLSGLQIAAAVAVLSRLSRGRRRRPPLTPPADSAGEVSVVIPARDEEWRIGPCLQGLVGEPAVGEVIVVDDGSTDRTAAIAQAHGARVVVAGERPAGWVGKPWALQRGLEEAGESIVVSLDADTRPRPGLVPALVAALSDADLVSAGARFECDTAGERWLHPALLATLVYRFGPPDATVPAVPHRLVVNGQCTAVRRRELLAEGGYVLSAGHLTDDAAQARALAHRGWRIAFHDGGGLISVDMHASGSETWREWGRSIALADVTAPGWLLGDVLLCWLTLGLPPLRVLARRAGRVDMALLALRIAISVPLTGSYTRRDPILWLAPLADPLACLRLTLSAIRPTRRWRGRVYAGARGRALR